MSCVWWGIGGRWWVVWRVFGHVLDWYAGLGALVCRLCGFFGMFVVVSVLWVCFFFGLVW